MATESYRIVFRGKLVEGVSRTEAETNLKNRFKYSDTALAKLFSGKGVVLKGGLDEGTANKYQKALAGLGLVCEVRTDSGIEAVERPEAAFAPVSPPEPAPVVEREQPPFVKEDAAEPEPPLKEEPAAPPLSESFAETVAKEDSWTVPPAVEEPEDTWTEASQEAEDEEDIWAPAHEEEGMVEEGTAEEDMAREAFEESLDAEDAFASEDPGEFFEPVPELESVNMTPLGAAKPYYQSPSASAGLVSATVLGSMEGTRPWVRLVSILLFLGSGLGLLGSLALLAQNMLDTGIGRHDGASVVLVYGVQALVSLLYLIPARYLFKYSSAIGALLESEGISALETALDYQKSFWKFCGIVALIGLILCILGILAAILIPTFIGYLS